MARKKLHFKTLNEVLAYAKDLSEKGYVKQGKWSLGQNCFHLAKALGFWQTIRSYKLGALLFLSGIPRLIPYMGEFMYFVGISAPAASALVTKETVEDAVGIKLLQQAILKEQSLKQYSTNNRLQLWHCGHHLGFLLPDIS